MHNIFCGYFRLSEDLRPVKLRKIVIGYSFLQHWSEFQFDMSLSYKLMGVINHFSEGKPSLVVIVYKKNLTYYVPFT